MPTTPERLVLSILLTASLLLLGCDSCGSNERPTFNPTTAPTQPTTAAAPPIAQRCVRAAEQAAEVLGDHGDADLAGPLRACIGMADGAWMLMPTGATSEDLEGEDPYGLGEPGEIVTGTSTTITYRVTYFAPNGETYEIDGDNMVTRDTYNQSGDSIRVEHVFDYDGDGNTELMLMFSDFVFEESEHQQVFWTFRDGEIKDYAPAEGIDVAELVDHDEDGRMDIVSTEAFYPSNWNSNNDGSVDGNPAARTFESPIPPLRPPKPADRKHERLRRSPRDES